MMKHHMIAGGGVSRLSVVEAGNHLAQPILFIHGISQCSLAWGQQLSSDLNRHHRLVAMDMRGHGSSDKPREGYDDSKLWAEDVAAVIRELNESGGKLSAQLREELARDGVDAGLIDTVSYGKDRPAAHGHDESAFKKNRRGEFLLETPPAKQQ